MDLYGLKLFEALEKLDNKEISAEELTSSCLKRIREVDPSVRALVSVCTEMALERARMIDDKRAKGEPLGRLRGIPGIIKDCISTKDVLSTASSKMLYNYVPVFDAHVVENLERDDYVLIAKANMDEFAMGSSTENSAFHPTNNPWNLNTVPGGSSGGSAACVAADEAIFALGSDTGGSIRQPAAFCGVVGVKPTYGTVSRYGLMSFASSLDQIGPITKDVRDAALLMNIISGTDERDSTSARMDYPDYLDGIENDIKGKKIGIPKEYLAQEIDNDIRSSYDKCISLLESAGAQLVEISLPTFDYALSAYYIISSAEVASNLARYDGIRYGFRARKYEDLSQMYKNTRSEGFGDEVKRCVILGNYVLSSGYYDAYYLKALKVRTLIKNDFKKHFDSIDAIISPVTPTTAFEHGSKATPLDMYVSDLFTVPVNIAGLTAMSIPAGISGKGMPIGVQIIADAFNENKMFNIAYNLEGMLGFNQKPAIKESPND